MAIITWTLVGAGVFLFVPACNDDSCGTAFEDPSECGPDIPPGAVEVSEGVYVTNAEESDEPMPTPSNDPAAPQVVGGELSNPEPGVVTVTVETTTSIDSVHLEIDGRHFIVDPELAIGSGDVADIDACEILAEQQGYSCTQACLEACGCVSCGQSTMEDAIEQACSVNCSVTSQQGLLDEEPWNGSEVTFAHLVYDGYYENGAQVPGLLEQFPDCDASVCAEAASSAKRYSFGIIGTDYPSIPIIGPGVVESQPSNTPSLASEDFTPPGGVDVEPCMGGECGVW